MNTRNIRAVRTPSLGRQRHRADRKEAEAHWHGRLLPHCPIHLRDRLLVLFLVIHALHAQMYTHRQEHKTLLVTIGNTASPCIHQHSLALLGHGKSRTFRQTGQKNAYSVPNYRKSDALKSHSGESCEASRNGRSDRAFPTAAHVQTRLPDNFFVGMLIRVETRQLACQHLPAHAASVKLKLGCFHDANRHAARQQRILKITPFSSINAPNGDNINIHVLML